MPENRSSKMPETALGRQIDEYLIAIEVEGKTPRTVRTYGETLAMFRRISRELDLPGDAKQFRSRHIYAFLKAVADTGVSLGTRHRRHRETRAFFSWCVRMGHCRRNPFTGIPNVRVEQKVIRPLSEKEIQSLLAACDPDAEYGCRNRAMILLLLDTGIRSSELHGLELRDVDRESRRIHIRHGKGRKQRMVAFGAGPADAVAAYVDRYRGADPGPLFQSVSRWGEARRAFNPDHLGTVMQRLGEKTGVHANPHRFRHTFATWAIENQARELDVQYLLGHSTSAMVRRYSATYDAAKAAEAHAMFSPADRLAGHRAT
ncbi:MAG: tyrosine-type recombinase/integrase [Dehalococcoidia bacterium]|jgi:integrase/recombinase XerC|nr:tyrosine-type recombinase/integrase [Dehalococcoidia bacterium]